MHKSISASDRDEHFRSMIGDLRERIYQLQIFNGPGEVDDYCTELEIQVTIAFESAVAHLGSLHQEMLKEIGEYRSRLLNPSAREDSSESNEELTVLAKEVEELSQRISLSPGHFEPDDWYKSLLDRIVDFKQKMRSSAFQNDFLKFEPRRLFALERDYLGSFKLSCLEVTSEQLRPLEVCEPSHKCKPQKPGMLTGLSFIDETNIACSRGFSNSHVLDPETGAEKFVLPKKCHISTLIALDRERLVSGTISGDIQMWDASSGRALWTINDAHLGTVTAFRIVSQGRRLASRAHDQTIKIWNPYAMSQWPLVTMSGCSYAFSWPRLHFGPHHLFIGELSNGFILANTLESDGATEKLTIWSSRDGKKVKEIETGLEGLTGVCVLGNDEVAIASHKGGIRILNVMDSIVMKVLINNSCESPIHMMRLLPSGHLLAVESKTQPLIRVWDPLLGQVVQTLELGARLQALTLSVSPDQKRVAIATRQGHVLFWTLTPPPEPTKSESELAYIAEACSEEHLIRKALIK